MIFVIKRCDQCPFANKEEGPMACSVATPKNRPLHEYPERPTWCKLRKEQIIVREAQ